MVVELGHYKYIKNIYELLSEKMLLPRENVTLSVSKYISFLISQIDK